MSPATGREDLLKGLWRQNPVLVQTLGMCPTLAVTNSVENCLAMGAATTFVLIGSCVIASSMRRLIPNEVRITAFVLIIATFVTIADMLLEAIVPNIHKALGAFVALIVVNCIILARQEAFASKNPVWNSFMDALGMSFGFIIAMLMMGVVREVLGNGTFLGRSVFGAGFEPWVIFALPPGGFLTLGTWLLVLNAYYHRRDRKRQAQLETATARRAA